MTENIHDDRIHLFCTVTDAANIIRSQISDRIADEYEVGSKGVRVMTLLFPHSYKQSFALNAFFPKWYTRSFYYTVTITLSDSDGECDLHLAVTGHGAEPDTVYALYHGQFDRLKKNARHDLLYREFTPVMYELLRHSHDFDFTE